MVICDRYIKIVNVSEYIQCNTLREGTLSFLNFPQILEKSTRQVRCAQCIKAFASSIKNRVQAPGPTGGGRESTSISKFFCDLHTHMLWHVHAHTLTCK